MHGSICCIVKKFVETQFGKAAWDEILVTAGFEGLQLSPIGVYPDEAVIAILGAGCELLDCELDDLLGKIGRFAGPELVGFASNMLHPDWKTFELLANVESLIHRTVRIHNPDAQPATIQAFRLNENKMQVVYSSRRGLCPLAKGILLGVSDHFNEKVTVREITCTKNGSPFCTFDVESVVDSDAPEDETALVNADEGSVFSMTNSEVGSHTVQISDTMGFDVGTGGDSKNVGVSKGGSSSGRTGLGSGKKDSKKFVVPFPKRLGRYEIHEILGIGGMGVVYRATDTELERTVAVKTLRTVKSSKQLVDSFIEEARAMARISHKNVIQVYDVGRIDNRPYFVMEFLKGQTLAKRLERGALSVAVAAKLFSKILKGIDAVHRIGLVHRDIKPDNIMLSLDSRRCHILDFGIADEYNEKKDTSQLASGTFGYVAPERLRGYPADYRSDYFSLGCVAYEMFSGVTAFKLGTTRDVINAMLSFDPRNLFGEGQASADWGRTPEAVKTIVMGLLAKNPDERICHYEDIQAMIGGVLESSHSE